MPLSDDLALRRAGLYRWFAQFLFQELTDEVLGGLRDEANQALTEALLSIPELAQPVRQYQRCLRAVFSREACRQELAADFASLFLLPPPVGVSPYAGHYPHTTSAGERKAMRQLLAGHQLAPHNNEAADHIAIQLALMARLVEAQAAPEQQTSFLRQHLLVWLPLFSELCQQRDDFGFYAAVTDLLFRFVQQDEAWMVDCL